MNMICIEGLFIYISSGGSRGGARGTVITALHRG